MYSEGGEHWDAMLNQTNLKNNNNKFYIIQLLQDNGPRAQYSVWFRWGRGMKEKPQLKAHVPIYNSLSLQTVGKTGQNNLTPCGSDLEKAKDLFTKK